MIISEQKNQISGGLGAIDIMSAVLNSEHEIDRGREHFWTIGLNRKNIIQFIELVSLGSSSTTVVHPREVFRFAVMKGVDAIILCHNHPSGDPTPSMEDIMLTKRLAEAGRLLGIDVLDHIILGKLGRGLSFHEEGARFREALFHSGDNAWQFHRDIVPAPLRKRRSSKKNNSGEAVAADCITAVM